MNPQLVWNVWRKALTDDGWKAAIERGDVRELAGTVSAEEYAILEEYASTAKATGIFLSMYRNRLPSVVRASLSQVAPHSRRLFEQLDEAKRTELVRGYLVATGNRDDGPRFCRTAHDLMSYLARDPGIADTPGWPDILALEIASMRVHLRLGALRTWHAPEPSEPGFDDVEGDTLAAFDDWALVWTGNAEAVTLEYDVTPWLEEPETCGEGVLFPGPTWWLASLADDTSEITYSQISERAFTVYARLEQPIRPTAIGASVADIAEDDVLSILGELLELGVIRAIRA
jgi:hypothetical protein